MTLNEFLLTVEDQETKVEIVEKKTVVSNGLFGKEKEKEENTVIQAKLPVSQILKNGKPELLSGAILCFSLSSFPIKPLVVYLKPLTNQRFWPFFG